MLGALHLSNPESTIKRFNHNACMVGQVQAHDRNGAAMGSHKLCPHHRPGVQDSVGNSRTGRQCPLLRTPPLQRIITTFLATRIAHPQAFSSTQNGNERICCDTVWDGIFGFNVPWQSKQRRGLASGKKTDIGNLIFSKMSGSYNCPDLSYVKGFVKGFEWSPTILDIIYERLVT